MLRFGRTRRLVNFEPSSVRGALVVRGLSGPPRVRRYAACELAEGVLVPGATDPNILRPAELHQALTRLTETLAGAYAPATLVLPDAVARMALVEPQGAAPVEYARFRLSAELPYPPAEAIVDAIPVGGNRYLAAAVRHSIVVEYEEAARSVGLTAARVDLLSFAARAGFTSQRKHTTVDVVLGEATLTLAASGPDGVRMFRTRRRDPAAGEAHRLRLEIERTANLAGLNGTTVTRLVGVGAASLARELADLGLHTLPIPPVGADALPVDPAELAWLGEAIA